MNEEIALEIAEKSYQQQRRIIEKLDTKSDNIIKYISTYMVLVNFLPTVLSFAQADNLYFSRYEYLILLLPAVITLMTTLIGQMYFKEKVLSLGSDILGMIEKHDFVFDENNSPVKLKMHIYDQLNKQLRKTARVKRIFVHVSYYVYILTLIIFVCVMFFKLK